MSLQNDFQNAVVRSRELTQRPSNEDLLDLYSLFKQATEGDATGNRPVGFDFKAIGKFDAWTSKKGISADQAMHDYVELVERLHKQQL